MSSDSPKRGHFAKEKGEIILREHEYDGIQEYDQKLPNWWLFTFYIAIAWTVVHWAVYYHTGLVKDDRTNVRDAVTAVEKRKQAELEKTLATLDDATLVNDWAARADVVASGEALFQTNCSACHAADLSGMMDAGGTKLPLPGLPLNDHQWKYGGKPMEIFTLINRGTPPESPGHNGARMQAWGQQLTPKQIAEVTAYIISKVPEDFEALKKSS